MTSESPRSRSRRVAVVTGANRGIGLAVAERLARTHHRVVMTGRNELSVAAAAEELRASLRYEHISSARLDVTDGKRIRELASAIVSKHGAIDVLVNNAAILEDDRMPALSVDPDRLRRTMEVNAFAALRVCQEVIPYMEQRGYGRIVNVSSGWGSVSELTGGGPAAYKLSKITLNAITRMLADEVNGDIKINAVDPGRVKTRMGGSNAPRHPDEAAEGIVWAATLPKDGPSGGFFFDRKRLPW